MDFLFQLFHIKKADHLLSRSLANKEHKETVQPRSLFLRNLFWYLRVIKQPWSFFVCLRKIFLCNYSTFQFKIFPLVSLTWFFFLSLETKMLPLYWPKFFVAASRCLPHPQLFSQPPLRNLLLLEKVLIFSRLRKPMVSFRILVSAELSRCQDPKIIWTAGVLNLSLFPVSPWAYWLCNKEAVTYTLLYCKVGNSYREKNKELCQVSLTAIMINV